MKTNEKTSDRKEEARFIERCKKAADKAQLGQAKANEEMTLRKIRSIKAELAELYKMTLPNGAVVDGKDAYENDLGIDVWEELGNAERSLRKIAAVVMSKGLKS
tara:strand:+ start:5162 stop:5473 length:312 start_codon:yes stop_codon:yes gene_type:complete